MTFTKSLTRSARTFSVVFFFPLLVSATGCVPGDLLGMGGDSAGNQFSPNYSQPAPTHSAALPCQDADATHLCVALNYVAYQNSGAQPVVQKNQAIFNVQQINT